jgi:hypothetical protein
VAAQSRLGGRIAYLACSMLVMRTATFTDSHRDFSVEKPAEVIKALGERVYLFARAVLISGKGLQMTPRRTDPDGFLVSLLRRSA